MSSAGSPSNDDRPEFYIGEPLCKASQTVPFKQPRRGRVNGRACQTDYTGVDVQPPLVCDTSSQTVDTMMMQNIPDAPPTADLQPKTPICAGASRSVSFMPQRLPQEIRSPTCDDVLCAASAIECLSTWSLLGVKLTVRADGRFEVAIRYVPDRTLGNIARHRPATMQALDAAFCWPDGRSLALFFVPD